MIPVHIDKIKGVYDDAKFKNDIDDQRKTALQNLQDLRNACGIQAEINYLDAVIQLFKDTSFLIKTPAEINTIVAGMPPLPALRLGANHRPQKIQLSHEIQVALEYKKIRDKFYPRYFRQFELKSCVYCNSQLTIVLQKNKTDFHARMEVDHHFPKGKYPYLSISLFNLYPCCASCNKRKSSTPVNFKLYTSDILKLKKSVYDFKITSKSKCAYLLTKDPESIEIVFNDNSIQIMGSKSLQDAFSILEIHSTQKDVVAELLIKSQIYNENFKDILKRSFSKLSLSQKDFERIIIGNYTDDRDIHKRPFSKLTMDIAKQLGLTKLT